RRSGTNHRSADTMLPHFLRQGFGKSDDAELRGAVYSTVGGTDFPGDRSNIDDVPAFAFHHGWQYETAGEKDPAQIRVDENFEIFVFERRDRAEDSKACRIDENVDRTKRRGHVLEQLLKLVFLAYVRREN